MDDSFTYTDHFSGIIVFILGEKEFCIDVENVSAIIKPYQLQEYYNIYSPVISMLQQSKNTFPLVDTKHIFGLDPKNTTSDSRIILIDCKFLIMGLYVEKIKEIITIDIQSGLNELRFVPYEGNIFIKGAITFENKTLLFPNIENICTEVCNKIKIPEIWEN